MTREGSFSLSALERCRERLRALAQHYFHRRFQEKLDPSDVVQQTLLTGYRKLHQFRGRSERELLAWLRTILRREIAVAMRRFRTSRRDVSKERPLTLCLHASTPTATGHGLASNDLSPSQHLVQHEQLSRLAEALRQLPEDQRRAVELHHLQGLSVGEAAARMDRSKSAVVGLLFRGIKQLRRLLDDAPPEGS